MDSDQNTIPSSEDAEAEPISNNIDELSDPITTNTENDCRINCTDNQSLRSILDITLNKIEDLANSCNLKEDSRSEFVSLFSESFKNALQENIIVNGLPLMLDENKKLSSDEKQDRLDMVDDVLFSKFSKKVATVAHERKFYPEQCRRISNIEMKHEVENLKKTKVTDSSLPSTSSKSTSNIKDTQNHLNKTFSDFCQGFGMMQETVQCKIQEKEKLSTKLQQIDEIKKSQTSYLKRRKTDKASDLQ